MASVPGITIPIETYNRLLKAEAKLEALEACGVDNWQGWDDAMDLLHDSEDESEEEIYGEKIK